MGCTMKSRVSKPIYIYRQSDYLQYTEITYTHVFADFLLSPRLLITNYKSDEKDTDPVQEARKVLLEIEEYNLIAEVVQAQFLVEGEKRDLLFEMTTPLQATIVLEAWNTHAPYGQQNDIPTMTQVTRNFFDPPKVSFSFRQKE